MANHRHGHPRRIWTTALMGGAPVIRSEGRAFPVETVWAERSWRAGPRAPRLEDAMAAYRVKPGYEHPAEHVAHYEALVRANFASHPELRRELLAFTSTVEV